MIQHSPEENITTLEGLAQSLKKTIEIRQNSISTLDGDILRLKALVTSENYKIGEQSKIKAELESQIKSLSESKNILEVEFEDLKKGVQKLRKNKDEFERVIKSKTEEIIEKTKNLEDLENRVSQSHREFLDNQAVFLEEKKSHEEAVVKFNEKVDRLHKALQ